MRYFSAKNRSEVKAEAYRIYSTDALYAISNRFPLKIRYVEALELQHNRDERTVDEIANDIISRAGLEILTDESS